MLTVEQAKALTHGQTIHHVTQRNAPRVSGKVWKTRPNDYRVPIESGLYSYGALIPHMWCPEALEQGR